ncbi:MAG: FCD domain-containing protein [candidate division Zixibacteria bacterium]|nr:FCD domain-containing protein [candidate division Zixibacteria bacterium]
MSESSFPNEFRPVNLVSQIAQFLEEAILAGSLPMGKQLVEAELSQRFNTSRPPIREAFRVLESKGLVTTVPWKGAFVKRITQKDFENHFPVRAVLDGLAARLAYRKLTQEDIKAMRADLDRMRESAAKEDFKAFLEFHNKFHSVFNAATDNDTLIDFLNLLRAQNSWFLLSSLQYFKENYEQSLEHHETILREFTRERISEEEMEKLVQEHVMVGLEYYRKTWSNQNTSDEDTES